MLDDLMTILELQHLDCGDSFSDYDHYDHNNCPGMFDSGKRRQETDQHMVGVHGKRGHHHV